jgi:hypothetical protein
MINQYEIGGGGVRTDAPAAIAAITENRTLPVKKPPVNPEAVVGQTSAERVFTRCKSHADMEFRNGEERTATEIFQFRSVGDFSVKSPTERSVFPKRTDTEKSGRLRAGGVLPRIPENPVSRRAFAASPDTRNRKMRNNRMLNLTCGDRQP